MTQTTDKTLGPKLLEFALKGFVALTVIFVFRAVTGRRPLQFLYDREPAAETTQDTRQADWDRTYPHSAGFPVDQNWHDLPANDSFEPYMNGPQSSTKPEPSGSLYSGTSWPNAEYYQDLVEKRQGATSGPRVHRETRPETENKPASGHGLPTSLYSGESWPDSAYYEDLVENTEPSEDE